MLMREIEIIWGNLSATPKPTKNYSDLVISFLDDLSKELIKYREYPDIVSFAFFCRRANIEKMADRSSTSVRIGRGLIFHIAPSNVPINFAYTFILGLLSGNSNIVKISSRKYPQEDIIIKVLSSIADIPKYQGINSKNCIIRYTNNDEITKYLSGLSDGRVIWGGDATIKYIRTFPLPLHSVDVAFPDRYSISIINTGSLEQMIGESLARLTDLFYNDTYLFDQNACSSPHIIIWYGEDSLNLRSAFWQSLKKSAEKYDLVPLKVFDKYIDLLLNITEAGSPVRVSRYGNLLYTYQIESFEDLDLNALRGKFGFFYQYCTNDLNDICSAIGHKCQTVTYFGIEPTVLAQWIFDNNLQGVDRVVPIGSALDFHVIWDGYNVVDTLSRVIDIK
jgi:hypothetical protein